MQAPSAHAAVQSSSRQNPFVAVTDVFCGTHSPRATRLEFIEWTDAMKHYARATYIRARSCLVNSELDLIAEIRSGVKLECVHVQCDMFWCENKCLYVLCDMLWYEKCMFACIIWYALVCNIYVRVRCAICFGVQDECVHVSYDMPWCAKWMFTCSKLCLLCCHELLETIVLVLEQTWVAKSVIENEL